MRLFEILNSFPLSFFAVFSRHRKIVTRCLLCKVPISAWLHPLIFAWVEYSALILTSWCPSFVLAGHLSSNYMNSLGHRTSRPAHEHETLSYAIIHLHCERRRAVHHLIVADDRSTSGVHSSCNQTPGTFHRRSTSVYLVDVNHWAEVSIRYFGRRLWPGH